MLAAAFDSVVASAARLSSCVRLRENDFQNQSRKLAYISPLAKNFVTPALAEGFRVPKRDKGSHKHIKITTNSSSRHRFFRRFFRDDDEAAAKEASRTRAISSASRRTARQTRRDVTTSRAGGRAPS